MQSEISEIRNDPEHRPSRLFLDHREAGFQDVEVSAEFINDEGFDVVRVLVQERDGPVQGSEYAAFVDIADEEDRCVRMPGHAHVHNLVITEIDLSRATRALDDDEVVCF